MRFSMSNKSNRWVFSSTCSRVFEGATSTHNFTLDATKTPNVTSTPTIVFITTEISRGTTTPLLNYTTLHRVPNKAHQSSSDSEAHLHSEATKGQPADAPIFFDPGKNTPSTISYPAPGAIRCSANSIIPSHSGLAAPLASPTMSSNDDSKANIEAQLPSFTIHSNSTRPAAAPGKLHHKPTVTRISPLEQAPSLVPIPQDSVSGNQEASILSVGVSSEKATGLPNQLLSPVKELSGSESSVAEDQAPSITGQPDKITIQDDGDISLADAISQPGNSAITPLDPTLQPTSEASQQSYQHGALAVGTVKLPYTITTKAHHTSLPSILIPDTITLIPTSSNTLSTSNILSTIRLQTDTTHDDWNDHHTADQPSSPPREHGHNDDNNTSGIGTGDENSNSGSKLPVAAIIGGTVGALAVVSLLILVAWVWRKKFSDSRWSSITQFTGDPRLEERVHQNDRMERGTSLVDSTTGGGFGRAGVAGFIRKSFRSVSHTMFGNPKGVDMSRGNSQFLEAVTVDKYTSPGLSRPEPRRVVSHLNRPGDFRVGMNLNLERMGEFSPFSDAHAIPPKGKVAAGPSSQRFSNPFSDTHMIPPPLAPRAVPKQRLRSRHSLGSHRHFQNLNRIQEADSPRPQSDISTGRINKFRSDPFDPELGNRLIPPVDSLSAVSKRFDVRRSSSRYSLGTMPTHSRLDNHISRPMSGISFNEWTKLGHDIRVAMMGRDDSSTFISEELRRFGERAVIHEDNGPPQALVGQAL